MPLEPGTAVGPYAIEGPLGAGGMGEVYRARDPRLGRSVALKILPPGVAADPDRRRRFEVEARAASALNHPAILGVFDVGFHEDRPYIVAELLEGVTLRARLAEGPLPVRKALDLARQIAEGLAAAHEQGIVHRDLKPENLFITRDGRLKILDFGLAKATGTARPGASGGGGAVAEPTETAAGTVFGTAGYMSPEQVRGHAVDHRSDIFSLGAILYEMLSGRRAFPGETPVERAHGILKNEPPPFEPACGVPAAVEWLAWRCLEKEPAQRLQSARDLAFSLEALAELPSGGHPTAPPPAHDRRRRLGVAGAIVLLGAVGAAGWLAGRTQGQGAPAPRALGAVAAPAAPHFRRVSFRRGMITSARFAPDGASVVYGASFEGEPFQVYSTIPGNPEARPLFGPRVGLLDVSHAGDVALALAAKEGEDKLATLARASLAGGAPREVLENVLFADWSPDSSRLMVVRYDHGRFRLEYPMGTLLYETASGGISGARIAPGGDQVAFFNLPRRSDTRGSLDVVDTAGRRRTLAGPFADLRGLAWRPDGREVWFTGTTAGLANELRAVTLDGRERVVTEAPGMLVIEDIAPDGRALLRRDDLRFRAVGLAPGETKRRNLSWFDGTRPTDLSRDGRKLLFVEGLDAAPTAVASYLRATDGSPAVRLGPGWGFALSPDGRWALHSPAFPYDRVQLLPTGVGEPKPLPSGAIAEYHWACFFPDGQQVLVVGREADQRYRLWLQQLDGTPPRPISPEGVVATGDPISPDGRRITVLRDGAPPALMPATGGALTPLPGLKPTDRPIGWSDDGKALFFVARADSFPIKVMRLELASGRQTSWLDIEAPDDAAVRSAQHGQLAANGTAYVLGYLQAFSDLYVVEGLR